MRTLILVALFCLCVFGVRAKSLDYGTFAIVVDEKSAVEAAEELKAYAEAIGHVQRMRVLTIIDRWHVPDSIRACLKDLHETQGLVGAVFVGDIPVPMIRDAQHLTSAFKMDQRADWKESSVPSDRFYDDFGLRFDYLGKAEDAPFYYYSLRADSKQYLKPDIFTGRIRPTDAGGVSRYEKLRRYLRKAVKAKYESNVLNQVFYFTGNGSLSESAVAAIDEKQAYYEHFPWLLDALQSISYMDFSQDAAIKERMMNELMRPDLDLAVLHHHGDWNIQYLSAQALPKTVEDAKSFICEDLRGKIRRKGSLRSKDSLIQAVAEQYDVPVSWLSDVFEPETICRDSLAQALLDLHLADFQEYGFKPNCRFVILDACYNGSFHREDCIANAYIFSEGETVAVIGGSVNVLQDKWYDKYIGLLGLGMYAGYVNVFQHYLESHLIGDPTFSFVSPVADAPDINRWLAWWGNKRLSRVLHRNVGEESYPDVQCLALALLHDAGEMDAAGLLRALCTSPYAVVRLQALQLLACEGGDAFVEGISTALFDRNEMVQRFAVNYVRQNGDDRLAAPLMRLFVANNVSARVRFNLEQALMFYPEEVLLPEFEKQFAACNYVHKERRSEFLKNKIEYGAYRWSGEVDSLLAPGLSGKEFDFIAACMRLYCPHGRIPDLLNFVCMTNREEWQVKIWEALGWYVYSCQADAIAERAKQVSGDASFSEKVRNEALKTYNRITQRKR